MNRRSLWRSISVSALMALALSAAPGAASRAADLSKTLRVTFQVAETGFDAARVSDYYSGTIIEALFDPLLTYDYLARPAKLVRNTTEAMPQITDNGMTYTFRIRKNVCTPAKITPT